MGLEKDIETVRQDLSQFIGQIGPLGQIGLNVLVSLLGFFFMSRLKKRVVYVDHSKSKFGNRYHDIEKIDECPGIDVDRDAYTKPHYHHSSPRYRVRGRPRRPVADSSMQHISVYEPTSFDRADSIVDLPNYNERVIPLWRILPRNKDEDMRYRYRKRTNALPVNVDGKSTNEEPVVGYKNIQNHQWILDPNRLSTIAPKKKKKTKFEKFDDPLEENNEGWAWK